ncbi:alpha/beta hydrolase [Paenibacillus woosongensis]|uniref:Prolyl oligopeptidase family serine peptidase n=1 Tax=Paenibacillus woosongensis TaxID=307580 RepID=A0A7X2YX78_9BACL|nr:alpha/beta hydrolase-fold protein [Paenibacillus woosongensis]MUG43524.1 prolyl oligopeptidase family serine peptidase [Paenibacillus woosongensis]
MADGKQMVIPRAAQWLMHSRVERRKYRIMVSAPSEPPPPSGYPVFYVLDANSVFGTIAETARLQGSCPHNTGVFPAVIVGIGYDTEDLFPAERYYDYTPATSQDYRYRPDGTPLPKQGGAAAFLQFIEEELKPEIGANYAIDQGKQTLFGHSLGGLFTLYTLFTRPAAFACYIAGSPSFHWNKSLIGEAEEMFVNRLQQEALNVKVLLGAGELELNHISQNSKNAQRLAERLSMYASSGITARFKEFEGEGHVTVLPALISRALQFAFHP